MSDRNLDLMSINAANPLAICTMLAPEFYQHAKTVIGVSDHVAVASTTLEFNLTTDANGNFVQFINFHGIFAPGTSSNWFEAHSVNNVAQQYDPVTGIVAVAGQAFNSGPWYLNNPNFVVRDYILLGATVEYLPTVSDLNNQGTFEVAMYKTAMNASFTGNGVPVWPRAQLATHNYYQLTNLKTSSRYTWMPTDPNDLNYVEFGNNTAQGGPP